MGSRLIAPIGKKHAWNTQRLYQEHGQKISSQAWLYKETEEQGAPARFCVLMIDVSRGISYMMPCQSSELAEMLAGIKTLLMDRYDRNYKCEEAGRYMCKGEHARKCYDELIEAARDAPDLNQRAQAKS